MYIVYGLNTFFPVKCLKLIWSEVALKINFTTCQNLPSNTKPRTHQTIIIHYLMLIFNLNQLSIKVFLISLYCWSNNNHASLHSCLYAWKMVYLEILPILEIISWISYYLLNKFCWKFHELTFNLKGHISSYFITWFYSLYVYKRLMYNILYIHTMITTL